MTSPVDIRPDQLEIVQEILLKHLPAGVKVWVFGSRANWTTKDSSDLDLALEGESKLSHKMLGALKDAFEDSAFPYTVDVVDLNRIGDSFRKIVESQKVLLPVDGMGLRAGDWIQCTVAEACGSINYGLTASASSRSDGPKFLRITDIVSGSIDWNTVPHVEADDDTVAKYRLHDGDIVIARTGASTGTSAYVSDPPPSVFASYLVRLQAKPEFDGRFLAYYLKSKQFWDYIRGVLGDKSAQPNASASTMTAAPFRAPRDEAQQRAIAHILGTLDDKIEINRRMNETLEEMARALFKSWFVDFDPVRAKMDGRWRRGQSLPGMPTELYDLFPDGMVDTELGEIPAGWEVKALDEIADFRNGLALQRFRPKDNEDRLPVVKIAQLRSGRADSGEWARVSIDPSCILEDGDIVFSWSGSLLVTIWCGGPAALNQHLFKVTSTQYPKWFYLHCTLSHLDEFRSIAADKATTMGHIKRHHLADAKCVVPAQTLLSAASDAFAEMLSLHTAKSVESRILSDLRDTVLPKLVSGEVRVGKIEKLEEIAQQRKSAESTHQ